MLALTVLILTAILLHTVASIECSVFDQCAASAAPLDSLPRITLATGSDVSSASASPPPSPAPPPPVFGFLTVGDWGCECGCGPHPTAAHPGCKLALQERMVAEKTSNLLHRLSNRTSASQPAIEFVLSVGDHFYDMGARGITDPRFQCGWADLFYQGPSTSATASGRSGQNASASPPPWFLVLGNHDYSGDIQAQIDYSRVHVGWNMPARYFSHTWVLPTISTSNELSGTTALTPTLCVLFLDTMHLCGDHHVQQHGEAADVQWNWLGAALAASRADFLLVVGHHPVFSGGPIHGNNRCLQQRLRPLLEAHSAHYMSGHEHTLQHLSSGGVSYFVSGTGCRVSEHVPPRQAPRIAESHFASFEHGLLRHSFGACDALHAAGSQQRLSACMTVEFFQAEGDKVIYSTVVPARTRSLP
jgi:tartrate-resistant acid phosphatase type 5